MNPDAPHRCTCAPGNPLPCPWCVIAYNVRRWQEAMAGLMKAEQDARGTVRTATTGPTEVRQPGPPGGIPHVDPRVDVR
jgi:hypothetical protein